jgi:tetratricopeptide (TPR) repeat protein
MKLTWIALGIAAWAATAGPATSGEGVAQGRSGAAMSPFDLQCGPVRGADVGMIDYRLRDTDPAVAKGVSDLNRFHTNIASAEMRGTRPYPGRVVDNLDFSLRHSPNHHEALGLLIRWDLGGNPLLGFPGARCSLDWARQFAPDDATVFVYGGNYFWKAKEVERARAWYERAIQLAPESAEAHYNYGLFFLDQGNLEAAAKHARAAYDIGFPLPGLREKLARAGYRIDGQTRATAP